MSKVISFRANDKVYNYFKFLDKPFSKSIPPILARYIKKMQNKDCIQPVCVDKITNEYADINEKVDSLIARYYQCKIEIDDYEE